MSKWVIFGASGFVGQSLVRLLNQHDIKHLALSSKALDLSAQDAPQKIASIVEDGDRILMLSAYTPEKGDARELTIKNLLMAKHLLAGIEGRAPQHVTYVSSDAVYPLTADIIDERTPPCPGSLYGHMHIMREQYVSDAIAPEKLTVLRPCAIYGEGDTHNAYGISRFIKSAEERGEIVLFGGGEEYRDHIHVDDFATIVLASTQQKTAGIFNAASGTSWRFLEIAECIKAGNSKNISIVHKPRALPILHRHVNTSKLLSTFPQHKPRAIDVGIRQLLHVRAAA